MAGSTVSRFEIVLQCILAVFNKIRKWKNVYLEHYPETVGNKRWQKYEPESLVFFPFSYVCSDPFCRFVSYKSFEQNACSSSLQKVDHVAPYMPIVTQT